MTEPLHVSMNAEVYVSLSETERLDAWRSLIARAGVTGAYLPIPFVDPSQNLVGMNIIRLETP